jgi:hypothetical protein
MKQWKIMNRCSLEKITTGKYLMKLTNYQVKISEKFPFVFLKFSIESLVHDEMRDFV